MASPYGTTYPDVSTTPSGPGAEEGGFSLDIGGGPRYSVNRVLLPRGTTFEEGRALEDAYRLAGYPDWGKKELISRLQALRSAAFTTEGSDVFVGPPSDLAQDRPALPPQPTYTPDITPFELSGLDPKDQPGASALQKALGLGDDLLALGRKAGRRGDEALDAYDALGERRAGRLDTQRESAREEAAEVARSQAGAYDQYQRSIRGYKAIKDLQRSSKEKSEADIKAVEQDILDAKVDPHRIFRNAISAVASTVAVGLGAYSRGLQGGRVPNSAYQILRDAMDRDIAAQKEELSKLKYVATSRRNAYSNLLAEHKNEDYAHQLLTQMGLKATELELGKIKAKYKGKRTEFVIDDLQDKIRQDSITNASKLAQTRFSTEISALGQAGRVYGQAAAAQAAAGHRPKQGDLKAATDLAGFVGSLSRTEDSWKKMRADAGFFSKTAAKLSRLKGFGWLQEFKSLAPELHYLSNRDDLGKFFAFFRERGKLSDKDFEIFLGLIPDLWASDELSELMFTAMKKSARDMITNLQTTGGPQSQLIMQQIARGAISGVNAEMIRALNLDKNQVAARRAAGKSLHDNWIKKYYTPEED